MCRSFQASQSLEAEEGIARFAAGPAVKFMEDKLGPYYPRGSDTVRAETPLAGIRAAFVGAQERASVDRM